MTAPRTAFVLEYALGHATHANNLKHAVASGDAGDASPVYFDLPFDADFGRWAKVPPFRSNWTLRASLAAWLALRRNIRQNKRGFDAALFHTQITAQFAHGFMRGTPSVVSLDATPIQMDALGSWYNHKPDSPAVETFKKRLTTRTFHAARRLVSWSQWAKDSLVADYGVAADKVVVIPPGIDLSRWDFGASRRAKSAGEPLNLLFVGADFERKGGDTLLAAWYALPDEFRNHARLHIVTKQKPILTGSIQNISIYTDIVPNDSRLLELFAKADLFVFPTRADCLPLAVMEAMAAGLPIITTAVAALPEAVIDGENGLIVPVGDEIKLRNAMESLLSDDSLRLAMSSAARTGAMERFDARKNYRLLVETVEGVAAT
ncbi:MAG: glycosyltransferase family 4 protein [Armatimonadetes bacterium]|nr:glycosyltransferase family 4 protein [Armatimonadota bacterium]